MSRISTGKARGLAKNYRDHKLDKKLKPNDTRGIWFGKEVFYEALGLVRDPETGMLKETKLPYMEAEVFPDGLRIYLAAYPENHIDENKKGRLTVVLVPTGEGKPGGPLHFDILSNPDQPPSGLDEAGGADQKDTQFNDGQLCPPPVCDPEGLLNF